jgi:hypothetical protein
MAIQATDPCGDPSSGCILAPVQVEATVTPPDLVANLVWTASVNGGAPGIFASGTSSAVYVPPTLS